MGLFGVFDLDVRRNPPLQICCARSESLGLANPESVVGGFEGKRLPEGDSLIDHL
jgi:hypothetical protein